MKRIVVALALWLTAGGAAPAPSPVDAARLLDETPAPLLSDYRLFTDAGAREPNAALVPYTLNTPLFSDYAIKQRYVFVPKGTHVGYRKEGVLDLPVGAVLVKTFFYPADFRAPSNNLRFIETRLLIHKQSGWTAQTYVWNDAQNEAVLKRAGARTAVSFTDAAGKKREIDYHVPNVNQCKQCHSSSNTLVPIGPRARNLNGNYPYAAGPENQIDHWRRIGLLEGAPEASAIAVLPRWDDAAAPLEGRARAYLDVNCAHCHSRTGFGGNSGLYLGFDEANPSALGVNKRPVAAGRGSGNLSVSIAPGHPEQSILLYRMESSEPGIMMPQIGRTVSDAEAVKLIRDYIAAMK